MKIELKEIPIKDVFEGYKNDEEEGVIGYKGKLNIRPKYQREFVYKDKQRDEVINTIKKDFPLNVMYWVKNKDGTFEVMDGQQRTISFCEYINGNFSLDYRAFYNLTDTEREQILNYKLKIYFCDGTDKEKLDWFKIINIAGLQLTDQELRNAIYTGEWLTDAKRHFSKTNCPAYNLASDYIKGILNRQAYLETAISWISNGEIEEYMAKHQNKPNANELWLYFSKVIEWVKVIFSRYYKEMKGVDFGTLYNKFKDKEFNSTKLGSEIAKLMQDDEVQKKSGIFPYVLTRDEKYLNLRTFSESQKREAYERQKGICVAKNAVCGNAHFEIEEMEADHIDPWHEGGKTTAENCQMLCKQDNRRKSGK